MSFQPVIPMSGFTGWRFLSRTMAPQQAAFDRSPVVEKEVRYFQQNIAKVSSAAELVGDRKLLKVALGAYGLDSDLTNKFFIQKVLEGNTADSKALVNKLADKRYVEFAKAFGFGDFPTPNTKLSDFGDKITTLYKTRQFEVAVGEQDNDMRLALSLQRDLTAVAEKTSSEDAKWFTVLGTPSLRSVFETAFNMPSGFGSLDLDREVEELKTRTKKVFGSDSVAQFSTPATLEKLTQRFMTMSDVRQSQNSQTGASLALSMLQDSQSNRIRL